jgi:hypothetical protein
MIWERWWRKPEAIIWERNDSTDYVALTVRMFAEAEVKAASAENRKTVRLMMADLYLTQDAKDRAKIRVAEDEVEAKREDRATADAAPAPSRASARDRMTVVDGGRS